MSYLLNFHYHNILEKLSVDFILALTSLSIHIILILQFFSGKIQSWKENRRKSKTKMFAAFLTKQ